MDINVFYTALAAVAATLLGLLFIAIQQNLSRLYDPHNRWRALADSTFVSYTLILVVALFTFIPLLRNPTLLLACLFGSWRQVGAWLPVLRLTTAGRVARLRETFWMLVSPVLVYAGLFYTAIRLLQGHGDEGSETNIASALILLLVIVLRNSWRLLVEIPAQESLTK